MATKKQTDQSANKSTKDNSEAQIETMKADLHNLREAVAQLTDDLAHQGMDEARMRYRQARTHAEKYGREARKKAEKYGREAKKAADDVGEHIEERPLTSVLTAFGVGLILGRLFGR